MSERKSLLFKLKNGKVDVDKIIVMTIQILDDCHYYFEDAYLESEYSITDTSFHNAYHNVVLKNGNGLEEFLDYCDLVITVLSGYTDYRKREYAIQVLKILTNALNQLGYGIKEADEKGCYECYHRDLKAEVVASTKPMQTKEKIYEYLSIRSGDIDSKRETLKSLIDDVDTFCKRKASIDEIKKAKHFYQCVRHPKDDPVKEFPFYYKDEEKWLDNIFQMIIDIMSFEDLESRINTIVEKENKR